MEETIIKLFLSELFKATQSSWEIERKFDDFLNLAENEVYGSELRKAWEDLKKLRQLQETYEKSS